MAGIVDGSPVALQLDADVLSERWKRWLVPSLLVSATWLGVACAAKQLEPGGASGDAGATPQDGAGNVPALDASQSDLPSSSDSPSSSDASGCPPLQGPATTVDQEVAYLCANPTGSPGWSVAPGTKECGGLLAIAENTGIDTQALYLFDPNTQTLVETMAGVFGSLMCTGSATGVDLTKGPAFTAADAAQCFGFGNAPLTGGGWDVQPSCNGACPGFFAPLCSTFAPPHSPQSRATPSETFDQALAYACAHPEGVDGAAVAPCVFSCNGFIGLAEYTGSDTANVELFDPSTKQLAEVGSAAGSPAVMCLCSRSGVPAQCNVPQSVGCMVDPCGDSGTSSIDASSE